MTPEHRPLAIYRAEVVAPWIDFNGHMNEGYFAVAFGDASDAYLEFAGFGPDYRETERGTFYTVETHVRFLQELKLGDPLVFHTTVLGVDAKRLHLYHSMRHDSAGYEAATQEVMLLHVDVDEVKVRPMQPALLATLQGHRDAHSGLNRQVASQAIKPVIE